MVRRAELDIVITGDDADLRRAVDRVNKELAGVGRASMRTGRSIQRSMGRGSGASMAIRNASFQFGDLAVQMAAGTSASRALAMQLPQLLGGFGTLGAVLGAVAAVAFPVATAMRNISREGGDVTKVFGTLQPLAEATAQAFRDIATLGVQFAEIVVNNLDRIIITAGVAATLLAGRFVAGFIAARVAALSFAGALTFVRTALIRTGIGAIVVAIGEGVYQFTRLASAAGGFGNAIAMVGDVFTEVWNRMRMAVWHMGEIWDGLGMIIQGSFTTAFGVAQEKLYNFINAVKGQLNSLGASWPEFLGGPWSVGDAESNPGTETANRGRNMTQSGMALSQSAMGALGDQLTGPLESVQAIRDLLASIKEDGIDLPTLLTGGEAAGEGAGAGGDETTTALGRALEQQREQIAAFYDDIRMMQSDNLGLQLQGWGSYFRDLGTLMGQEGGRLQRIAAVFDAAMALRNAWVAYTDTLAKWPDPFTKFLAAGKVLAAGIGAVSAIKQVGSTGGGPTTSGAAGGATAGGGTVAPAEGGGPSGPRVSLTLIGDQGFSRAQIVQIAEALNDSGDEGQLVELRGRR